MKILSGIPLAKEIMENVSRRANRLHARGVTPTLAVILVGNNAASTAYIRHKRRAARKVGIDFLLYCLPADVSEGDLEQLLITLSLDKTVHGVIIQLPLPKRLELKKLIAFLSQDKDIDCLHPRSRFKPPTATAVMELMHYYKIRLSGKKIGVVGRGLLVGKPLVKLLRKSGANVSSFDKSTKNLADKCRRQDILVTATGRPGLINERFINKNQVVIDVGCARDVATNKVVGDVDYHRIYGKVAAVTPRLGGVGPLTIVFLLGNVVEAAESLAAADTD